MLSSKNYRRNLQNIDDWPAEQICLLAEAGVLAWGLPAEFGGHRSTDVQMLAAYERWLRLSHDHVRPHAAERGLPADREQRQSR